MQPIVIIITPGPIIAFATLLAAALTFRLALTRRAPLPRRHGLKGLD
jgi:hypothetical protein